jgi:uncharacterized membrane protein
MKSLIVVTCAMVVLSAHGFSQETSPERVVTRPEKAAPEPSQGRYVTRPIRISPGAIHSAATPASVPLWSNTVGTYTYQMVGTSPLTTNTTTTIAAPVIPLILTFSDGTVMDPTVSNSCSSTAATTLMQASPLFNNSAYTVGGTSVGTTTFHDFFQRANFWKYTQPSGTSPNYHTILTSSTGTPVKITVPAASGSTLSATCGKRGLLDLNFLDSYLQSTGFTQLASNGVLPSQLPVFLLYNTVMYETTTTNCCVLGYHSAFNNPNFSSAVQTYVVADFETSGAYGTTADVAPFSHEIGEWLDDPLGNNPTPPWGNVGQVTGCQSNLEDGDPLSGTITPLTMSNSYTYHLQELAFTSWFYRQSPSTGVNGWYSSNGTFTSGAAACDPTSTTLSITPTTMAAGIAAIVSATVTPSIAGEGTPTGTVALISGNTGSTLATYSLGSSTTVGGTLLNLPTGSYNVTAKYSGDATFETSTSAPVALNVGISLVTLNPVALTFTSLAVGSSSAAQAVALSNTGTAPLSGIAVSIGGINPGDYSQTNNCGTTVAAGGNCTIHVTFKPTTAGIRTATVSISDSGIGSPQMIALTGTATGTPAISLTPSSLSFGSVNTGSSGAAQVITVKNTGSAALTITSLSVKGTNIADFPTTSTCSSSLAAGSSCTVSVTFKPSAAGARSASVSIADNATGSPQTVALTGTGVTPVVPVVSLSATSLAFGSVTTGASKALSVTITNTGTAALSITLPLTITGTVFTDITTCTATLAVGASCTATVTFTPTASGSYSGTLSIADNASGSPQKVTLTGTGVTPAPVVSLSASSLAFGSVTSGSSKALSVTITNTGTAALSITLPLTITGTAFTDTTTCTATLAASASCTATVTFTPTAKGSYSGSLSIADNATGSPQKVTFTGTGK